MLDPSRQFIWVTWDTVLCFFNQCITGKDLKKDEVDFNSRPVHSDYGTFMYTTNSNKISFLKPF